MNRMIQKHFILFQIFQNFQIFDVDFGVITNALILNNRFEGFSKQWQPSFVDVQTGHVDFDKAFVRRLNLGRIVAGVDFLIKNFNASVCHFRD